MKTGLNFTVENVGLSRTVVSKVRRLFPHLSFAYPHAAPDLTDIDYKRAGFGTLISLRRDQLLYLEDLANDLLNPPISPSRPFSNPVVCSASPPLTAPSLDRLHPSPSHCANGKSDTETGRLSTVSSHPEMTIALFDFVSGKGLTFKRNYPMREFQEKCGKYINIPWADRVARMIQNVATSRECNASMYRPRYQSHLPPIFMSNPY